MKTWGLFHEKVGEVATFFIANTLAFRQNTAYNKFMRWSFSASYHRAIFAWLLLLSLYLSSCVGISKQVNLNPVEKDSAQMQGQKVFGQKEFGIYQWDKSSSYEGGLQLEINRIGTTPKYAMYFVDKDRGFPKEIVEFNRTRDINTVLSQELCTYADKDNSHSLDSILQGKWDKYFRQFARDARESGETIYYRFGYEMNGNWFAWGEQPVKFTQAWKRAWKIFHEEKATNVKWVFSANVIWGNRTFKAHILPYYPGSKYVDIVGLDGYNFGDNYSRKHAWQSYDQVFQASLNGMKKHFKNKPLWITEIGCAEGPRKAAWMQDFFQHFNADPALKVFVWFNENKQYAGEPNWRFDSDDDSLRKFRQWVILNNSEMIAAPKPH